MKLIPKLTEAPIERRRELRDKILKLLNEYSDVPIVVMQKYIIKEYLKKDGAFIDYSEVVNDDLVDIFISNTFENENKPLLKLKLKNFLHDNPNPKRHPQRIRTSKARGKVDHSKS